MKTAPQIHSIFITPEAGAPMVKIEFADLIAGQGISGDRYAAGIGAFSKTKIKIRHISFIALQGMEDANRELMAKQQIPFAESDTRRNVIISGISVGELNALVSKTFYLGGIAFKGTELCEPCQRPAKLLNRPDFMNAFENRGGLRAEALMSGHLSAGDLLHY